MRASGGNILEQGITPSSDLFQKGCPVIRLDFPLGTDAEWCPKEILMRRNLGLLVSLAVGVLLRLSAQGTHVSLARPGLAPHRKPPNVLNWCFCSGLPPSCRPLATPRATCCPPAGRPQNCLQGRQVISNEMGRVLFRASTVVAPSITDVLAHLGEGAWLCDLRLGTLCLGLSLSTQTTKGSGGGDSYPRRGIQGHVLFVAHST